MLLNHVASSGPSNSPSSILIFSEVERGVVTGLQAVIPVLFKIFEAYLVEQDEYHLLPSELQYKENNVAGQDLSRQNQISVFFSRTRKRHAHLFINKEEKRIQNGPVQEDPHYGGYKHDLRLACNSVKAKTASSKTTSRDVYVSCGHFKTPIAFVHCAVP
jgi:hypothetical protein